MLLRRADSLNKQQNNWEGIWPSEEVVFSVQRQPVRTKTNMSNEALQGPDTIAQVCEVERKPQYLGTLRGLSENALIMPAFFC